MMAFSVWRLFAGNVKVIEILNWLVMLLLLRFIKLSDSFACIDNLACVYLLVRSHWKNTFFDRSYCCCENIFRCYIKIK